MARTERLAAWMRQRLHAAGCRGLLLGLSGGVDSAVAARLSQLAAPGATLGVLMPCHSDPMDEEDALLVARHLSLPTVSLDLSETYDSLVALSRPALAAASATARAAQTADPARSRVPLANMKPRLRMATLYFLANSLNYLVVGASNRSDLAIGYLTKHGDGGGDLLPLGALLKRQVRALAADMGLPPAIVNRTASPGLWLGQTDEEEMGFGHADLERYLENGAEAVYHALAMKIERLIRTTEHKREMPAVPAAEDC